MYSLHGVGIENPQRVPKRNFVKKGAGGAENKSNEWGKKHNGLGAGKGT